MTTPRNFRPEKDVEALMDAWLKKNPSINQSILMNMSLREFLKNDQILKKVEITDIPDEDFSKHLAISKNKNAKTLKELE